ncbi:MAG: HTTM domain-containing protein [Planctomycetota bacterium]
MSSADLATPGAHSFFFPLASPLRLSVMRVVAVFCQLVFFYESLDYQLAKLASPGFSDPQWFIRGLTVLLPESVLRTESFLTGLWWATYAAGVFAMLGYKTRGALLLFALGNMIQIAHVYSYGEHHHPEAAFCVFLLMMAFSPCGRALSVDAWFKMKRGYGPDEGWGPDAKLTTVMWPLVAIQCFIAIAYFDAFLSKAIVGGLHWMNGYTLQTYLLRDGLRWDRPVGVWMSQFRWLGIAFAVGAVVFDALFWTVLLPRFKRLAWLWPVVPLFLLAGTAMHITIYVAQAAPFFQFLVLYLTFVPWERWGWLQRVARGATIKSEIARVVPGA